MKKLSKRLFITLLSAILLIGVMTVSALAAKDDIIADGKFGDSITWTLTEGGTLTLEGEGEMYDAEWLWDSPVSQYSDDIKSIVMSSKITTIGDYAFGWCRNLKSVTLHEGLTRIGNYAFSHSGLKSVTIPASVVEIGDGCFGSCLLERIDVAEGNTSFYSDDNGVLFNFDKTKIVGVPPLMRGDYSIPDGVKSVQASAFEGSSIQSLYIPSTVETMGARAFDHCLAGKIEIDNGLKSIGYNAFRDCFNLSSITIPASVAEIGAAPFEYCEMLTSINVDSRNEFYKSDDRGVLYDIECKTLIQAPERLGGIYVIPYNTETIGESAFFYSRITGIVLPDSLTEIDDAAFAWCGEIEEITLPAKVERIGSNAFLHCNFIEKITFEGNAPSIADDAFTHVLGARVYTPAENATWTESTFRDYGGKLVWMAKPDHTIHADRANFAMYEVTGAPGETVEVPVYIYDNTGIDCFSLYLAGEGFTVTDFRLGDILPDGDFMDNLNEGRVSYGCIDDEIITAESGIAVVFTIKIDSDAKSGAHDMHLEYIIHGDDDEADEYGLFDTRLITGRGNVNRAKFAIDDTEAKSGDTVDVEVYVTENMGFAAANVKLVGTGFTIVDIKPTDWTKGDTWSSTVEEGIFHWHSRENTTKTEPYAVYTIKIDDNLKPGEFDMEIITDDPAGVEVLWDHGYDNDEYKVSSYRGGVYANRQYCYASLSVDGGAERINGDFNGNGEVNNADLVLLARWMVGLETEGRKTDYLVKRLGDFNNDNAIDNSDLVMLARSLVTK